MCLDRLIQIGNRDVPISLLGKVRFLIIACFAYLGFQFGQASSPLFSLGLAPENNFFLFWIFSVNTLYWTIAFGWSCFFAAFAFQMHGGFPKIIIEEKGGVTTRTKREEYLVGYSKIGLPKGIQQFFLNFIGSIIGWIILALFFFSGRSFGVLESVALITIALLGIAGYLPYMLIVKNWFPGK